MVDHVIVSCYYEIPSKTSKDHYYTWMDNFMDISVRKVIFTDQRTFETLSKKYPETENRTYILKEISEFRTSEWDWSHDESIDTEKHVGHNRLLYQIWNEKPFFVKSAAELFPQYNAYIWCDIGYFRSFKPAASFPNPAKYNLETIQFLQIRRFDKDDLHQIEKVDERFRFKNRIGGGMFVTPRNLIDSFIDIHVNMIHTFTCNKYFKGKDQSLFAFEILQNPDLFTCIHPERKGDPFHENWFYFANYLS